MSRKPKIENTELLTILREFFTYVCNEDISNYSTSKFGEYIRAKGYDVEDYLIRRNPCVKEFVNKQKEIKANNDFSNVSVYKELDVKSFVEQNKSNNTLIKAIVEREGYYKTLAFSAANIFNENKEIKKLDIEIKEQLASVISNNQDLNSENGLLKSKVKRLNEINNKLYDTVRTYIYPEIANTLLKEQGLLVETAGIVDEKAVDNQLIKFDSQQSFKNEEISNLFKKVK